MTGNLSIAAFADLGESVTLLWLRGLDRDANGDWYISAVLRELGTGRLYPPIPVPFGLMPYLRPGHVFHEGRLGATPDMGELASATIPALRQFEFVPLRAVPPAVFPRRRVWDSDQVLYLYRTPELDLYVPPVELVRHLFLHERVLANAILRRGALADLWAPVHPEFVDRLELNFTAAMPVSALSRRFVREFAWLAVHPTGERSWRSVARLSKERVGIRLEPPKFENSRMIFTGLIAEGAALVLEILGLPGKEDPYRSLHYTHPALRNKEARPSGGAGHTETGEDAGQPAKPEKDFQIRDGAAGVNARPDAVELQRIGDDFVGNRGRIRRQYISATSANAGRPSHAGSDESDDAPEADPQRETVKVSVADISLAFRILEPAPPEYLGELEVLIETLKRMREQLSPGTRFASALCLIPDGTAISWVGRYRRPCLIAKITPRDSAPVVLLDVDHAGEISLSALSLHFARSADPAAVERGVSKVLHTMDNSGHWPPDIEHLGRPVFRIRRIKRMLRRKHRADDPDYQTRWAASLIEKLQLE